MKAYHIFILLSVLVMGCNKIEPQLDQSIDSEVFWKDKDFAMSALDEVYNQLPAFYSEEFGEFLDCATDNAVTNNFSSDLIRLGTGSWNASQNPLDNWTNSYIQLRSINKFIEKAPGIIFSNDPAKNVTLSKRLIGEAYFLRAYYQFQLLSRFAGVDASGTLKGFPIILKSTTNEDLSTLGRNSFDECVNQILADIDVAVTNLPATQYAGTDVVLGATQVGRAYKLPALSLKSRLLLYAASPAYTVGKSATEKQKLWENAAIASFDVIKLIGTLPTISSLATLYRDPNHPEIIWRSYQPASNTPEDENFMPSLWGNGRTNPSQQLVDAFPMKDGYPIDLSPAYDPANPYANRDKRFDFTIVYNDATFGNTKAEIYKGGKDAESAANTRATRTGYYLRKFIDPQVVITPGESQTTSPHYYAFFRCAEIWLNFAEAANEAWGPLGNPLALSKTSQSALKELRTRAGIVSTDPYLVQTAALGTDSFRTLIQNERRVELSFENHRFFDVRRWLLPLAYLNQNIKGVKVTKTNSTFNYQFGFDVETRTFKNYMYYNPIPEQVIYASKNSIVQNAGW